MATHLRALQEPDPLPPAQRLTPTEAVPIHIPAMQETTLARPSCRSSVLAAVRVSEPSSKTWPRREMGGIQMSATTRLFLGSVIAIA